MHRYSYDTNPRTDLICDHCGHIVSSIPKSDKNYLISIISREIMRKVRIQINEAKKEKQK